MSKTVKKHNKTQKANKKSLYDMGIKPGTYDTADGCVISRLPCQLIVSIVVKIFKCLNVSSTLAMKTKTH